MRGQVRTMLSVLVCVALFSGAMAKESQAEEIPRIAPAWTLKLESPVLWQQVASTGNLVISSGAGLYGVDPENGTIIWRQEQLRNLSEDRYEVIPGTPFVILSDESVADRVLILDTMDGRTLFDSTTVGISQVLSSHLLPQNRALLIFGLRPNTFTTSMSLLDIAAGKLRWTNHDILAGSSRLAKFAAALMQAATDSSGIICDPLEIGDDAFLIASQTGIYKIDADTGEFLWKTKYPRYEASGARLFLAPDRADVFFVAAEEISSGEATPGMVNTYYSAHRVADGGAVWRKPVKLKGSSNEAIFLGSGMLIASAPDGGRKIKLVDYATGAGLWGKKGKGLDVAGAVVDHESVDGGLLLVMGHDSAWTNRGVEFFLDIVDVEAGALRFKKALKVKGRLLRTEVVPRGVLYITTSEINFLDPKTGQSLQKPVFSDGSLVTAVSGDLVYAYSNDDGALYVADRKKATLARLSKQKVTLADKDLPDMLEVEGDRLVLSSSQNVVSFGLDGTLQFHAHHPAPRQPAILRALYTANAVRAAMASAASGTYSAAFARAASEQEDGTVEQVLASGLADGYSEMTDGFAGLSRDYFQAANARFKASALSEDSVFMMVRTPGKQIVLARVSKQTGKIVEAIDLGRDKEPDYQVDAISNRVYYRTTASEITGYAFQ